MEVSQFKIAQELIPLRKGQGISPLKLQDTPTLHRIAAHILAIPVDKLTNNQIYNFLLSELAQLPDNDASIALRNALGTHSSCKYLSQRRANLASALGKHPDTIEIYENQGINCFAAHLAERDLRTRHSVHESPSAYRQDLEQQAKATRDMTTIGLTSHLSLANHGEDLMRYLEMPRRPYLDASVHITLLPSQRRIDWYRFRLSYSFKGIRESFRIAVVLDSTDGEQLMASGLVDDYHRLDNADNLGRDIKTIIASAKFTMRNPQKKSQKLLRLREMKAEHATQILESASKRPANFCWLLEVVIPTQWQTEECIYEYLSWINLPVASVAYWYSPTLMYLKKLTLDFHQFPDADKREFFLLPFLGHAPGIELREKYMYILNLNNWIMPGHGLVLGWQDSL